MNIKIPELSLVVLIGASGSGKSTFARRHFKPTEILSSDACRAWVADDENDQTVSTEAFSVLHHIAGRRLSLGNLTVIDATNVQDDSRRPLITLAREFHVLPVAIVFDLPARVCIDRNRSRTDRNFGDHVIHGHRRLLHRALGRLQRDGFRHVFVLRSIEEVEQVTIAREPLWNNRRGDAGPFDIIGDIHGCFDETIDLLKTLGYTVAPRDAATSSFPAIEAKPTEPAAFVRGRISDELLERMRRFSLDIRAVPPPGRKAVFLGDLVDRGPGVVQVLKLAMSMVAEGTALCVPGNHDAKLMRKLRGRDVQITHGLAETLDQLSRESDEFRQTVADFIDAMVSHYVLDDGRLCVAHAGMKAEMIGRGSAAVRDFALYGETTGETDEFGLPVRYNWAEHYRGRSMVVYGHTPIPEPEWLNNTINIDTGCVFGGRLTALRYPERELVSVPARATYATPARPLEIEAAPLSAQQQLDDVLDLSDVLGKRIMGTRLVGNVTIREENAIAAMEVMSRFAANPKWLVYLPPTMSPCRTAAEGAFLERPEEVFEYFRTEGVAHVICEEKHMGSRAIVVVCRDEGVAQRRFGIVDDGSGIAYARIGRRFFDDRTLETGFIERVRAALTHASLWDELSTDWIVLDCELMPWSAKAQQLLRLQYAAVGAAARASFPATIAAIGGASARLAATGAADEQIAAATALAERYATRHDATHRYTAAYQHYCWPVTSLDDLRLAPFHILATEGHVHSARDHIWHMETIARVARCDPGLLLATPYRLVNVVDDESQAACRDWWHELTRTGGEGMVAKPVEFTTRGGRGLVQPAIKCRGREYLRIIYGPEYTLPENIERLRSRAVNAKRGLAAREFALGIEALERFVRREPLRRVHECVFGVLALESEPVDPRL